MTKQEIIQLINTTLTGQGSQVDIMSKLPEILYALIDIIPAKAPDFSNDYNNDFQGVMDRAQALAILTVKSSAESFEDASDLDKDDAAEALGITADELDDLMAGNFVRFAYGENNAYILGIDAADGSYVSLGGGYLQVSITEDKYAIDVA